MNESLVSFLIKSLLSFHHHPLLLYTIMKLSWELFKDLGLDIVQGSYTFNQRHNTHAVTQTSLKDYITLFGSDWHIVEKVWNLLDDYGLYQKTRKPDHLLWALLFLRTYSNERVHATLTGSSQKTFRRWVWRVVEEISLLEVHKVSY